MSEGTTKRGWFRFSLRTMFVVVAAFVVGWPAAMYGVASSMHGGSTWPLVPLCAPVLIPAILIARLVKHEHVYVSIVGYGTAMLYGVYAIMLSEDRPKRAWLYVFVFHLAFVILVSIPGMLEWISR